MRWVWTILEMYLVQNPKENFRSQMEIAKDLNMPVIFHNRDADEDVLSILKEFPGVEGVAHCFRVQKRQRENLLIRILHFIFWEYYL